MKKSNKIALGFLLLVMAVSVMDAAAQPASSGRLFTVDDTGDSIDSNPGDGICEDSNRVCTLRAAIQEANRFDGINVIDFALPWGSVIDLTLGELLITKTVHIVGPGARRLTVRRSPVAGTPGFRIFHINAKGGLTMIIRGFTVRNGNVDGAGGAFFIEAGNSVKMSEVAAVNNAANRGGAIANAGRLNLSRSLFTANTALTSNGTSNGAGGALMNLDGSSDVIVANSTITGNSAITGGGIYNRGTCLTVNNTIDRNSAMTFGRNIVSAAGGSVNVLNTIISSDNSSAVTSLWGPFSSVGNNLITDGRNTTGFADGVNGDQVSNDNSINPLLGALGDNGGQTDTSALGAGSPAIDRGNNCITTANCPAPVPQGFRLSSDQRNFRRVGGGTIDIGSYETQSGATTGSLGLFFFGNRPRLAGSLVILTAAGTNQKLYRPANPIGSFSLSNLSLNEIYILEIISKRAGLSSVMVFEFDSIPFLSPSHSGFIKISEEIDTSKNHR